MTTPIDQARIDANWRAITFELDAPRPSRVERIVRRMGVPSGAARLVVATPGLRRSWWAALVGVILVGLGSADPARPTESLFTLLVLAPLLPVLGVALAYGPSEPAHELALATPRRGLEVLGVRLATVLGVAAPAVGLAALASPAPAVLAVAWLLPALGCTLLALAMMTMVGPRRATAVIGVGWPLLALAASGGLGDRMAPFSPAAQALWAVLIVATGALVVRRRAAFDLLSPASGAIR